jgi:hypothetical protein
MVLLINLLAIIKGLSSSQKQLPFQEMFSTMLRVLCACGLSLVLKRFWARYEMRASGDVPKGKVDVHMCLDL